MRTELDRPKGPIMNESGDAGRDVGTCVLRARGLRKEYGKAAGLVRAVDGVSLDVDAGQALAVMGPSGCGKSTLLHLLGGLDRPTDGELYLTGLPPSPTSHAWLPGLIDRAPAGDRR